MLKIIKMHDSSLFVRIRRNEQAIAEKYKSTTTIGITVFTRFKYASSRTF
jgi:hypothetical protein